VLVRVSCIQNTQIRGKTTTNGFGKVDTFWTYHTPRYSNQHTLLHPKTDSFPKDSASEAKGEAEEEATEEMARDEEDMDDGGPDA
jgi:hypothetical protein